MKIRTSKEEFNMRTIFDQKLDELHRDLLRLGILVNRAIEKSINTFIDFDLDMAREVIEEDHIINNVEHQIERKCSELIAIQQPNASDLRRVIAVLRASTNLERMGDHAQNIAEATMNIEGNKRDAILENIIREMSAKVLKMSEDIIDAFVDFDVDQAINIARRDIEVDNLYNKLRYTAVISMKEDPNTVYAASDYSFIGMDLERIGDYVTNIAEDISYLKSGEIVDLNRELKALE